MPPSVPAVSLCGHLLSSYLGVSVAWSRFGDVSGRQQEVHVEPRVCCVL